jgi:phage gpG-like protein
MAAVIEVKTQEIDKLAKKLNSFALTPSQKVKLLKSLGLEIEEQTKERFDTKQDPEGNRWRGITDAYRKYLAKYFPGAQPPLVREGYLRGSIEYQMQGSDTVIIGSPMEYADYHQSAKSEKRRRQFLGLSTSDISELSDAVDDFMEGQVA